MKHTPKIDEHSISLVGKADDLICCLGIWEVSLEDARRIAKYMTKKLNRLVVMPRKMSEDIADEIHQRITHEPRGDLN